MLCCSSDLDKVDHILDLILLRYLLQVTYIVPCSASTTVSIGNANWLVILHVRLMRQHEEFDILLDAQLLESQVLYNFRVLESSSVCVLSDVLL